MSQYYDDGTDYLLAVTIPYIPRATCNTWYSSEGTPVGDTMICAGVRDKGFCDVSYSIPFFFCLEKVMAFFLKKKALFIF